MTIGTVDLVENINSLLEHDEMIRDKAEKVVVESRKYANEIKTYDENKVRVLTAIAVLKLIKIAYERNLSLHLDEIDCHFGTSWTIFGKQPGVICTTNYVEFSFWFSILLCFIMSFNL